MALSGVVAFQQASSGRQSRSSEFSQIQVDEAELLIAATAFDLLANGDAERAWVQDACGSVSGHLAEELERLAPMDCMVFYFLTANKRKQNGNLLRPCVSIS